MENIGKRIHDRRIELGMSADDLAEKIGKDRATIYRYENGDIEKLPTKIMNPLAKALQCTPGELMGFPVDNSERLTDTDAAILGVIRNNQKVRDAVLAMNNLPTKNRDYVIELIHILSEGEGR